MGGWTPCPRPVAACVLGGGRWPWQGGGAGAGQAGLGQAAEGEAEAGYRDRWKAQEWHRVASIIRSGRGEAGTGCHEAGETAML